MNIEKSLRNLSFYDGTIQSILIEPNEVLLCFVNWQGKLFSLRFSKVTFIRAYRFGSDVSEVKITSGREAILKNLAAIDPLWDSNYSPNEVSTTSFQIDILEDEIVFTAVFEELEITEID